MRYTSNEATEIDGLKWIFHILREKPEKSVNSKDRFLESSLRCENKQTQHNGIDCQDKEITVPEAVIHVVFYQDKIQ
jgi:hypothetical protein